MVYVSLIVSRKQNPIADSQKVKKRGGASEYSTMESHQFKKAAKRKEKKSQWNYKTSRKQLEDGIKKLLHINHYSKCK